MTLAGNLDRLLGNPCFCTAHPSLSPFSVQCLFVQWLAPRQCDPSADSQSTDIKFYEHALGISCEDSNKSRSLLAKGIA
jgi:hypothetical protein